MSNEPHSAREKRFPPDDPQEWLNRARSNLAKAEVASGTPGVYLEDLCFDVQQAAEKAIKAVLIHLNMRFPYVHDLARLLGLVEQAGQSIPTSVRQAGGLSDYAVETRYPGLAEPVTWDEYDEAFTIAEETVRWAQGVIEQGNERSE
jgi:HEPN domain-containing protein